MFELIGLVFVTMFLFCFAGIIGGSFAFFAWLLLKRPGYPAPKKPIVVAAALPVICALYICVLSLAWSVLVPDAHASIFGDISEPLPNGYTLTGLAKMPDYTYIEPPPGINSNVQPPADIGRIAVEGSLVYVSISRPFGEAERPNDERGFYIFNTQTGEAIRFDTLAQMQSNAGHSINLRPASSFNTLDRPTLHLRHLRTTLLLSPPCIAIVFDFIYLIWLRRSYKAN